ncbi:MAG: hypothetical protein ABJA87_02180 [bacterium]
MAQDGPVRAMRATRGDLPVGAGWAYEMCWAGTRLLLDVTADGVRAEADGRDVTDVHADRLDALSDLPDAVVDGVLVEAAQLPGGFVVVDLLRLYGVELTARTYWERRRSLDRLAEARPDLAVSPAFDDGPATVHAAQANRLPGVLAKRWDSVYRPGGPSPEWVEYRFPSERDAMMLSMTGGPR